jgi:hypothetical protein
MLVYGGVSCVLDFSISNHIKYIWLTLRADHGEEGFSHSMHWLDAMAKKTSNPNNFENSTLLTELLRLLFLFLQQLKVWYG